MGLVASKDTSSVMLIRRELVSWLRPIEALEQVIITGGVGITTDIFSEIRPISDNPGLASDVLHMLVASSMVGRMLPQGAIGMFNDAISTLQSPDLVSRSLAQDVLADQDQPGAVGEMMGRIGLIQDMQRALECLLYCLELDRGSVSSGELDISDVERDDVCRVFSSDLGTSIVAESLKQQIETRLWLSQQLLVTQHLIIGCGTNAGLTPTTLDMIQSTFLPRTTVMVHCYSVLNWLCTSPVSTPNHSSSQQSLRQMAVLKIGDNSTLPTPKENSSILELFLAGPGTRIRSVVGDDVGDAWLLALPPLTNMTAQLLWPRCAAPTFLHFLLTSCQHGLIQQYSRFEIS